MGEKTEYKKSRETVPLILRKWFSSTTQPRIQSSERDEFGGWGDCGSRTLTWIQIDHLMQIWIRILHGLNQMILMTQEMSIRTI